MDAIPKSYTVDLQVYNTTPYVFLVDQSYLSI